MNGKHHNQQQDNQTANPETLAVSDEKQRTQQTDADQPKDTPLGNERDEKTRTEGSEAGMGE